MKPFNLAEAKITERNYCKQHLNHRLRIIALFVGLTLCITIVSFACKLVVIGKVNDVKSDLADVQGRYTQIKKQISGLKTTSTQHKWQTQLAVGSKKCVSVLTTILNHVPQGVWLKSLVSSTTDMGVVVEGHANSFGALSEFIGALRCSSAFTEVRLNGTKVTDMGTATFIDFSLQLKLGAPTSTTTANVPTESSNTGEAM